MKKMLIFVETNSNKNKYYRLELVRDTVQIEYGRVGGGKQITSYAGGQKIFDRKVREKLKKGYTESKIDLDIVEESTNSTQNVMDTAMEQIVTDKLSKILILKLVQQNIHNITNNTKIKYDIKTGYFKTALGIITKAGVNEALDLLEKLTKLVSKKTFKDSEKFRDLNNKYFSIIPTRISTLREFNNLLMNITKIEAQKDICEALLSSIDIIATEKAKIKASAEGTEVKKEILFDAEVLTLKDKKEFKRINDLFNNSKNSRHGHNSYKVSQIYTIALDKEVKEYRNDLNNHMELFHGTKVSNLLSILKSGLLMPKYSPGQTTGYMYGQGLYFANQSTKSLNYCDGMYWAKGKSTGKIYMFVADIAMGNYQVPTRSRNAKPESGYDSYWAKSGKSGIMNDEMIVFNNNQIKLKYILEIEK